MHGEKDVNRYSFVVGSTYRAPDGFDTGRSFLTTRLNQLYPPKLVEPTRERQRAGRVETTATTPQGPEVGSVS